jgi:cysteine desulfurase
LNAVSIYLDHNATTPLDPRVLDAMNRVWRDHGANPASQHAAGRKTRRVLEEAREGLLELLGGKTTGMQADRLIFTSGGTEANHLALHGLLRPERAGRGLMISALEHPSIQSTAEQLARRGLPVERWPVQASGTVDLQVLPSLLNRPTTERPQLVSVMLASNETGVLQPVEEIGRQLANTDVLLHSDAVQAVGKIPVHFRQLGLAAMTVAAHKLHGPVGIGALVLRDGVKLEPQLFGGFQQAALRPGTENAALAVGFHTALQLCQGELTERDTRMKSLRDGLQQTLRRELPGAVVIGGETDRLPHTLCIAFPGLDRQALIMALDLAGVACSTGSACASGSSEPSPTLVAMGLAEDVVGSAIRLSLGAFSTAVEMDQAADRILKTVNQLQRGR